MTRRGAIVVAMGMAGCAEPDLTAAFNQLDVAVETDPSAVSDRFADVVDGAKDTVLCALPAAEDTVVAEALIDAWTHGRTVEVVTDFDRAADPGIAMLIDAGVPVQLADAGLDYFDFNLGGGADVHFGSGATTMSHAYAIADGRRAIVASRAGFLATGDTVVLKLTGEELIEDLTTEHNQLFGGTDATATTAFDALAKSIADFRWRYPTQGDLDLELWLGPQQRLVKRTIDAIYAARGSVFVLTNDLTDTGLARALQSKAASGFSVHAVVGPAFDSTTNQLSRVFANETPDVDKRRYTGADDVPTVVITDWEPGLDGVRYTTRAMVITHDLYSASRIDGAIQGGGPDDPWIGTATDQLIDGGMWVLVDYDEPSPEIQALFDLWDRHHAAGGAL